jgi:hypothetical protein
MYVYLFVVHLAVCLGYWKGLRHVGHIKPIRHNYNRILKLVALSWVLFIIIDIIGNYYYGLSITKGIEDPIGSREIWGTERAGTVFSYIGVFIVIPHAALIGLVFGGWSEIRKWYYRILGIVSVFFAIIISIIGGSRSGFWQFMTVSFSAVMIGIVSRRAKSIKYYVLVSAILILSAFILYTSWIGLTGRVKNIDDYREYILTQSAMPIDKEHWIFDLKIPKEIETGILQGIVYFGHSYHGLALCLNEPLIITGFGAGQATFLRNLADRILGDNWGARHSYFTRMVLEEKYPISLWGTGYPWVASDVTFVGTIFVYGFVGYLLARSWISSIYYLDAFAINMFVWMMMVFFHIYVCFPTGSAGEFLGFYGSIYLYFKTRKMSIDRTVVSYA